MNPYLSPDSNPFSDKPRDKTRVVVAMSGGVDSSVVAALMVEQGYDVVGMTMQLYDHGAAVMKAKACCAGQDIHDAREVANQLGIPHYVLDYESRFKEQVMEDFAQSYVEGYTPIPCVRCNQTVKFKDMLQAAKDIGADALVTGHYVQRKERGGQVQLLRGADHKKDQSYFLFATTAEQLAFVHFPLGGLSKGQTREHAQRFGLAVAEKPDSQDICFVPNGNYASVVEKLRPGALDAGEIVHVDGRVLGRHDGIINYTVGQRKGLGIGGGEIFYVVKLDVVNKRVIVGPKEALMIQEFVIEDVNWLESEWPDAEQGIALSVKVRSNTPPFEATLLAGGHDRQMRVQLHVPEKAITPGQACVFYDGERVLGGGWITKDHANTIEVAHG